ncbi:unnamed protein product [Lymnaea stagnalis]|uniref:Uncharacterized protein n=1 Tax=Lymnaea stagnalis TaxID=6523 RepID=A0AAV2I0J4_LYMST
MHGIFSSLKEITDSLSTHGQLLQTFITDVNESIHGRNVEFDATTEGVMQEIKKSNETTSNLIDMFNKLQLQHEETAKEMKKGYERTLQLERRVKRGKENSKKIKYELEKRKNAVRKKNKEINQIKIQGEMSKSKLQELQKQLETQRRMQSNKKLAFNKMQADLDKKQEILSQNIKNYCDDLKQQNTEANITLTNLLTNVKAEWLNEIKQLNTVTRQGLSDDLQTLKDTIVNSAVDKKLIQDIDVTTKKIIRPQPKFPEAGGNK